MDKRSTEEFAEAAEAEAYEAYIAEGELAQKAISLAKEHASKAQMRSSADLCIEDAEHCLQRGDFESAMRRAKDSLKYSVGILSPIFREL